MREYLVGVDVGGSKVLVGLAAWGEEPALLDREKFPTEAHHGEDLLDRIFAAIDRLISRSGLKASSLSGLGIVVPGPVDVREGRVLECANVPSLKGVNIRQVFGERYGLPIGVENDAHAAALAEARGGAGRAYSDFVYVCLGTGIGGGLIIDGKLHGGRNGVAGEISHLVFPGEGELYAIASGKALWERYGMDAMTLAAGCEAGVPRALEARDHLVRYIGAGLANVVTLLNPEAIVIGGGLCAAGRHFLEPLEAEIRRMAYSAGARDFAFVRARFAEDSGVVGALHVCRDLGGR